MYNDEASIKAMQERKKYESVIAPDCSTFRFVWGAFWGYPSYKVNKLFGGDKARDWYQYRCSDD